MEPWPDLRSILHGIPWVIVGGVATRAYMPERVTRDMDILVSSQDGEAVRKRLESAGYATVSRLAVPGYLMRSPEGIELDVIFGKYDWLNQALANPGQDAAGYPVIDLAYLVLMKLTAQRTQDWTDVSRMLGDAPEEQLAEVRAVVARYSPIDSEDLEALIFLGKKEFQMPEWSDAEV